MKKLWWLPILIVGMLAVALIALASVASANHAWGGYHWARTANPFTLKIVDSMTSDWDVYLGSVRTDWDASSVLNLVDEQGYSDNNTRKSCKAPTGKVRACNAAYGFNGWLGLAQIWASGSHITKGVAKVNDSYFNTTTYNTPAWRNLVLCQEPGHTFGLGHQDEKFDNANLGTCMDYTNDPTSNQHPNQHDYDQLVTIYGGHTDSYNSYTTQFAGMPAPKAGNHEDVAPNDPKEFGTPTGTKDGQGRDILFEKDLGGGRKLFTWVVWAEGHGNPDKGKP